MKFLIIDVGGSHVKIRATNIKERIKIPSGPKMTAAKMVWAVLKSIRGLRYDAVTIGYPGKVVDGKIVADPHNLGTGWVKFNFKKAFKAPVKIINDAAMQALGGYRGRRMLFLGLGTGLGSALIVDGILEPMELAHLVYKKGRTYEEYIGVEGLKRLGEKRWRNCVIDIVTQLKGALEADYVVLGGGNAKLMKKLPSGTSLGSNENAFNGGCLLWSRK